jgi:hypothetical protein
MNFSALFESACCLMTAQRIFFSLNMISLKFSFASIQSQAYCETV